MQRHVAEARSSIEARVLDLIDERAWLDLTCELVPAGQPDSENPLDPDEAPGREEGAALLVASKLRDIGFDVDLISLPRIRRPPRGVARGRGKRR